MFEWFRRAIPVPVPAPPEPQAAPPPPEAAPADPAPLPLAAAARRRQLAVGKRKINADVAIGMRAAGIPANRVAEVMEASREEVFAAVKAIPGGRELITTYRERLKVMKLHRAHRLEGRMWSRLEKELDEGTAKDVDAMARALHAAERIQASAAGDSQRVEVGGIPGAPPLAELQVLIQNLIST